DGVLRSVAFQQGDDLTPEKGPIHTEFAGVARAESRPQLREQVPEESQRRLAIVDVARSILHPQDLPALRLVGGDRVVARHLAAMRVETPLRPLDLQPGRDHGAVDVDGETT